jgi:hypothetical protein
MGQLVCLIMRALGSALAIVTRNQAPRELSSRPA